MSAVSRASAYPDTVQPGIPRLGVLPKGWTRAPMSAHLYEVRRPVDLKDDVAYDLVTVKRGRGGVVKRDTKLGRDISVKTQFRVEAGDFLISKRQIVHGACGIVPPELHGSTVSNEYAVLRGHPSIDLEFLRYLSHTVHFQQTCFHSSIGVHIEKMIFKTDKWFDWPFDIPPLREQRRIVGVLSTWDRAIAVISDLLTSDAKLKFGLMQRLLSGELRFNGHESEWTTEKLSNLCAVFSGGTPSRSEAAHFGGDIPWIKSGELNQKEIFETEEAITQHGLDNSSAKIVEPDTVLLALYGATAGVVAVSKIRAAINQAVLAISPREGLSPRFLYFQLERQIEKMKRLTQGGQPNLSAEIVKQLTLAVTTDAEQSAISAALSDADRVRFARAKLRATLIRERASLIQELLTGKRRLSPEDLAA